MRESACCSPSAPAATAPARACAPTVLSAAQARLLTIPAGTFTMGSDAG